MLDRVSTAHSEPDFALSGSRQPEDIWSTDLVFQNRTQILPCYRVMDLEGIPIDGKEPKVQLPDRSFRCRRDVCVGLWAQLSPSWLTDG